MLGTVRGAFGGIRGVEGVRDVLGGWQGVWELRARMGIGGIRGNWGTPRGCRVLRAVKGHQGM